MNKHPYILYGFAAPVAFAGMFLLAKLPYFTDFGSESDESGWDLINGAEVVAVPAPDAEQSIVLPGSEPAAKISREFSIPPEDTKTYIDFFLSPVVAENPEDAVRVHAGESKLGFARVGDEGRVFRWEDSFWWDTGASFELTDDGVRAAEWLLITIEKDWSGNMEGLHVNADLVSRDGSAKVPGDSLLLEVVGGSSGDAYFADLYVGVESPLPEVETGESPLDPETVRSLLKAQEESEPDIDLKGIRKMADARLAEARERLDAGEVRSSGEAGSLQVFTPLEIQEVAVQLSGERND